MEEISTSRKLHQIYLEKYCTHGHKTYQNIISLNVKQAAVMALTNPQKSLETKISSSVSHYVLTLSACLWPGAASQLFYNDSDSLTTAHRSHKFK